MIFGRLPRIRLPHVPHLSALLAGAELPPPPPSVDYTAGMPADLGQCLNNSLGDCTCAAFYHALQVWSFNAQPGIDTEPDCDVLALYEGACGYNPADPSTDQGGIEQEVLKYLLNTGAPVGPGGLERHRIAAFIEVDPRNTDDVKRTIADCAVAYIGFRVPHFLVAGEPPAVWDIDPNGDQTIEGGHAVVLAGYDAQGATVISWGQRYRMTWGFFSAFTDEVYAIADPDWIKATGKTPAGLTLNELEQQMAALRAAS